MGWDAARAKCERLVAPRTGAERAGRIAEAVRRLDELTAADLAAVLSFDTEES